jgi:hypothetical protein
MLKIVVPPLQQWSAKSIWLAAFKGVPLIAYPNLFKKNES